MKLQTYPQSLFSPIFLMWTNTTCGKSLLVLQQRVLQPPKTKLYTRMNYNNKNKKESINKYSYNYKIKTIRKMESKNIWSITKLDESHKKVHIGIKANWGDGSGDVVARESGKQESRSREWGQDFKLSLRE